MSPVQAILATLKVQVNVVVVVPYGKFATGKVRLAVRTPSGRSAVGV